MDQEMIAKEFDPSFRPNSQRLLGLIMQFISREDGTETFLNEGRQIVREYGVACHHAGYTISQAAENFQVFRRSLLESVISTTGLNGPNDIEGACVFLKTNDFFDSLLVTIIEKYHDLENT